MANNQDTGQVSTAAAYWTSTSDQQLTLSIWQAIATRYASNPWVAGYDLINEPYGAPSQTALWNAYNSHYTGIRSVDPNHMIFMEATWGDWNLDALPDPSTEGWTNVVYQVHEYQWNSTTNAAGIEAGTNWRVQDYKNHLSWNVPYMVGEFNDFGPGSTPAAVWDYTVQQYQQNGISWMSWAYKSDQGSGSSWGIYDKVSSPPPIPNLQTASSSTIQTDWSEWTTANSGQVNGWLQSAVDVNGRAEFSDADIGLPGQMGGSAYDPLSGLWTVLGGGSDVQGTSDQFNFSSQPTTGDQTLVVHMASVQNTDPWAKAGLMYRASTAANDAYAFVFVTPGNGVGFEYRSAAGSTTAAGGYVSTLTAPVWLKLIRSGNAFTAFYSSDGVTWKQIGGAETITMSATIQAGLAVTAHNNSLLNTSTFQSFNVLSAGWTDADVGTPNLPGSAMFDGQNWTVTGGGLGISGYSDQVNLASQSLAGDGTITAQVYSQENSSSQAMAGVMIRSSNNPGAQYVGVFAVPGNSLYFQWRPFPGGSVRGVVESNVPVPAWVRLTRVGNSFNAYYSTDGTTWKQISTSQTIAMGQSALAGLAVTAAINTALNTATFTNVTVTPAPFSQFVVTTQLTGHTVTAGTGFVGTRPRCGLRRAGARPGHVPVESAR